MFPSTPPLPEAVLLILAGWFLAGTLFYLYRTFFPEVIKANDGYWDLENEIVHGLCLFGMVPMLSPALLPIPSSVCTGTFVLATIWFTTRSLWWGRYVPYHHQWWWDWTHVGMLAGMTAMFAQVTVWWLVFPLALFWAWLTGYCLQALLLEDIPSRKWLDIGATLYHATMGLAMLLMIIFPSSFMGHNMAAMSGSAIVSRADEAGLRKEIFDPRKTTFLFVWGGCEKCTTGAINFDRLAKDWCSTNLGFIRVNKDKVPNLCQELGIHQCPVVLVINRGVIVGERLQDEIDEQQLSAFVNKHLRG